MSKKTSRILSAIFKQVRSRPTFDSMGIEHYRQLLEKGALAFRIDPSIQIKPFKIGSIEAEWLIPADCVSGRTILYTHGGGYIAGSINSHRDLASRVALASNTKLLIFNYRLAPEHPFPGGLNDVKAAYNWICEQPDINSICLAGDSAGAGLSLALACWLLEEQAPLLPSCLAMISPWMDLECENNSHIQNHGKDFMLSQKLLKKTARLYTDQDLTLPEISPINGQFTGMPPILIQAGECEILLNDSKRLKTKLETAGVDVRLEIWDEMFHVWHYFAKYLQEGKDAIKQVGEFIEAF